MQENLHLTVAAVIEQNERFLLVEESINGQILYNQPAGHLEENETLIEAVIRETREETAAFFKPSALTGIYQWTQPANQQTFLRFSFTGDIEGFAQDQGLDEGILRAVWFTLDEIKARQAQHRSPIVLQCIHDYQQGHRYPLDMISHIT